MHHFLSQTQPSHHHYVDASAETNPLPQTLPLILPNWKALKNLQNDDNTAFLQEILQNPFLVETTGPSQGGTAAIHLSFLKQIDTVLSDAREQVQQIADLKGDAETTSVGACARWEHFGDIFLSKLQLVRAQYISEVHQAYAQQWLMHFWLLSALTPSPSSRHSNFNKCVFGNAISNIHVDDFFSCGGSDHEEDRLFANTLLRVDDTPASRALRAWPAQSDGIGESTLCLDGSLKEIVYIPYQETSRNENAFFSQKSRLFDVSGIAVEDSDYFHAFTFHQPSDGDEHKVANIALDASPSHGTTVIPNAENDRLVEDNFWDRYNVDIFARIVFALYLFDVKRRIILAVLLILELRVLGVFDPLIEWFRSYGRTQNLEQTLRILHNRRLEASRGVTQETAELSAEADSVDRPDATSTSEEPLSEERSAAIDNPKAADSTAESSGGQEKGTEEVTPLHRTGTQTVSEQRRELLNWWKKAMYQSFTMFFMTLLPWWNPNPVFLED